MQKIAIVIPCYNEADRLQVDQFDKLAEDESVSLIFVNDGSTDQTNLVLQTLVADLNDEQRRPGRQGLPDQIEILTLAENRGKGEAVRVGMKHALARGADIVGYIDADLSTPVSEVLRLANCLCRQAGPASGDHETAPAGRALRTDAVLGSRIAHLGADIQRKAARHYLGRVFASFASLVLQMPIYDTQCGAKFFRRCRALSAALAEPFFSRWAFDVELLGRFFAEGGWAVEVPLLQWKDVSGSKIGVIAMIRAGADLAAVARALRNRRRRV